MAFLLCCILTLSADDFSAKKKWKLLPDDVSSVYIGPDKRLWLQKPAKGDTSVEFYTHQIVTQFHEKKPEVRGCKPVLFEDNERVWFLEMNKHLLFGYDGSSFVTNTLTMNKKFTGGCPDHGRSRSCDYNLQCGDSVFFPDSRGVHVYADKHWSYQPILSSDSDFIRMYRELDGLGVLAVAYKSKVELWRWRSADWHKIDLPDGTFSDIFPAGNNGVWLVTEDRQIRFLDLNEQKREDKTLTELLNDFKSAKNEQSINNYSDKIIEYCQHIQQRGGGCLSVIKDALNHTSDPLQLAGLLRVIEFFRDNTVIKLADGYIASSLQFIHCDCYTGMALLLARGVSKNGHAEQDACVIYRPETGFIYYPNLKLSPLFIRETRHNDCCFIMRGNKIWVDGNAVDKIQVLDSVTGEVSIPDVRREFLMIHAVRNDSSAFIGVYQSGSYGGITGLYDSNASDNSNTKLIHLKPKKQLSRTIVDRFGIDSSGGVWTVLPDKGICRFYNDEWNVITSFAGSKSIIWFHPGDNGSFLGKDEKGRFFFYNSDDVSFFPDLKKLIEMNYELIKKDFTSMPPCRKHCIRPYRCLVSDRQGNVWLLERNLLNVFNGEKWFSRHLNECQYINSVGGRNEVYIEIGQVGPAQINSLIGRVVDGVPRFEKGHLSGRMIFNDRSVRDGGDGLWVDGAIKSEDRYLRAVFRLAESGTEKIEGYYDLPLFNDSAGNVWLPRKHDMMIRGFDIWNNDKIVNTLKLDGDFMNIVIAENAPGSVYIFNAGRLYHYIADSDSGYTDYKFSEVYALIGVPDIVKKFEIISRKYAVLSYGSQIEFFKLPERGE